MLSSIRRAYLNVDEGASAYSRQEPRDFGIEGSASDKSWSGVRSLTNEERDQIDLQAKIILSKCADRVKQMEVVTKGSLLPYINTSRYI